MYYTENSILPENMAPLIITAAPYGPAWLPGDASDIAVSWDEQVQAAVDCYKAGATMLHFHVRNPATGMGSTNFDEYNYLLKRVKEAVPEMIIQVGGSISFAPHTDDAKAKWLDYDTRHMLTELDPKPEFVTVTTGTTLWDISAAFSPEDVKGTHMEDPKVQAAWSGMVVELDSRVLRRAPQTSSEESHPALLRSGSYSSMGTHRTLYPRRHLHGAVEHGALRLRRRDARPKSVRLDALPGTRAARIGQYILVQHERTDFHLRDGTCARSACASWQRGQPVGRGPQAQDNG